LSIPYLYRVRSFILLSIHSLLQPSLRSNCTILSFRKIVVCIEDIHLFLLCFLHTLLCSNILVQDTSDIFIPYSICIFLPHVRIYRRFTALIIEKSSTSLTCKRSKKKPNKPISYHYHHGPMNNPSWLKSYLVSKKRKRRRRKRRTHILLVM
jgi:hypothetical protein